MSEGTDGRRDVEVAIIGAGFGGITAAIELRRSASKMP